MNNVERDNPLEDNPVSQWVHMIGSFMYDMVWLVIRIVVSLIIISGMLRYGYEKVWQGWILP